MGIHQLANCNADSQQLQTQCNLATPYLAIQIDQSKRLVEQDNGHRPRCQPLQGWSNGLTVFYVPLHLKPLQRLSQRIGHEIGLHGFAYTPTHDTPGVHVNHEGHIQPALPGADISEVRHHNSLGRLAWKTRLTRSSGHGADVSGVVVRTLLPRRAPCNPRRRISRSTVRRTTRMPSRLSCSQTLAAP